MPRKRHSVKSSAPIPRTREEPSSVHQFESMVEYIHRRSFLNFITSGIFAIPEDPLDAMLYGGRFYYPGRLARNGLQPHSRIRELAEEEAEKHAEELIEEEKRSKEKAEKNRRKKQRKKEKRLEKQNAAKALLHDEEGNSENQVEEGESIESDGEKNGPVGPAETEKERVDNEEGSEDKQEEEKPVKIAEEEDVGIKSPVDPTAEEKRSKELAGTGCDFAAAGQYEMAVKYFTAAIKCNPVESKFFGNRSLCYERMGQYENAHRDAEIALSLEPKWIKGLFRKGKALCGLKRYYEASLIYREVIELDSSSVEAKEEMKQAQTLHLMEMGFSWAESSKALKTHTTMEEAIESLFHGGQDAHVEDTGQAAAWEECDVGETEEWVTQRSARHRAQRPGESPGPSRVSPSPTPRGGGAAKPTLFPVWVGVLAPSVTYDMLHQLFSRAGTVCRIKMLLEQQCAFVSYTREEDCSRAVQCFNGKMLEGAPLTVRYPSPALCSDSCRTKECFFWRTAGCTRSDCIFKHDPNHRGIDRDKFTSGLGNFHT